VSESLADKAHEKALLYGVRFDGVWPEAGNQLTWTDFVTGGTFLTKTVADLPDKIREFRKGFMVGNPSAAEKLSERFFKMPARFKRQVAITWPKRQLVCLGAVVRVDYLSDKFDGKTRCYYHRFEKPMALYTCAVSQPNGSNLLIVHGKFKIESAGITG
jgi:hypothetical protein